MAKKRKKDRIPKELILLLSGSTALAAAAAYLLMTRKPKALPPTVAPTPLPQYPAPLPPPPPGSYNASIALPLTALRSFTPPSGDTLIR